MKYSPSFKYVTRFQYNLMRQNKRPTTNVVVVSPKVARDIEHMKDYIAHLEKELQHKQTESALFNMGLVKS